MRRLTFLLIPLLAVACDRGPVTPTSPDVPLLDASAIQRPVNWAVMDLKCPDGSVRTTSQSQSITPLDENGDLVLVGTTDPLPGGCPGREDWFVYDISSGEAVLVDAIHLAGVAGIRGSAHSPAGYSVGYGVQANRLVIYDGGFRTVVLPMSSRAVWAASPSAVWVGGNFSIVRYDGTGFVQEWAGDDLVRAIWGHGETALFANTLFGMLQRKPDGTWDYAQLPAECDDWKLKATTLFGMYGRNPNNVWAVGQEGTLTCLLHYDGKAWGSVVSPNGNADSRVWPLDANRVLVAGQDLIPVGAEEIAFWGSTDAGATWAQFSDPRFAGLAANAYRGFFNMSATRGGNRIYLVTIFGGKLLVGTPQDFSGIAGRGLRAPLKALPAEQGVAAEEQ